ncbi:hypothetical protein GCM10009848_47710 [Micromonospora lupini]
MRTWYLRCEGTGPTGVRAGDRSIPLVGPMVNIDTAGTGGKMRASICCKILLGMLSTVTPLRFISARTRLLRA